MKKMLFFLFILFTVGCMSAHEHLHTWDDGTTTRYKSIGGTSIVTGGTTRDIYVDCDATGNDCREQEEIVKNTSLVGQFGGMGEAGILRDGSLGSDNIDNSSASNSKAKASARARSSSSSSSSKGGKNH